MIWLIHCQNHDEELREDQRPATRRHRAEAPHILGGGIAGLDKPMIPLPEPYYDIRVLADNVKMMTGNGKLPPEILSFLGLPGH
jgi:hypothetical protein